MRALVYGAGVIGCYLAHVLCSAGTDVTLLARGRWKTHLEQKGLTILHSLQRKITLDHPRCIDTLDAEPYDVVFASMQHQQMGDILEDLVRANAPIVVLVGNNMSALEMERYLQEHAGSSKVVLFGFQGTGGRREEGKVVCVRVGAGSMSIGGLHTEPSAEIKTRLAALFSGTKYRLTWVDDMDAWYKSHLALILPVAYLCYTVNCDLRGATHNQRRQVLDSAAEGYALLQSLGYPIRPSGEERYVQPGVKRAIMSAMLFAMAKTVIGDLAASDHCRHAVSEMEELDRAWMKMRERRPDIPMPNWENLRANMPDWKALRLNGAQIREVYRP